MDKSKYSPDVVKAAEATLQVLLTKAIMGRLKKAQDEDDHATFNGVLGYLWNSLRGSIDLEEVMEGINREHDSDHTRCTRIAAIMALDSYMKDAGDLKKSLALLQRVESIVMPEGSSHSEEIKRMMDKSMNQLMSVVRGERG